MKINVTDLPYKVTADDRKYLHTHTCKQEKFEAISNAFLPTKYGPFKIYVFKKNGESLDLAVLVKGQVAGKKGVPVRVHSECLTGDAFGSMKCDCGEQLAASLEYISKQQNGIMIYLRQEGRGIGLMNKIRAYALQDKGMDTVEANTALGFLEDNREYHDAALVLEYLEVGSINILTNNPEKIRGLVLCGIRVDSRITIESSPNKFDEHYLLVKKAKLGHMLSVV